MKVETTPYAYSDEPYEGPNNFPRPSGRLDGDHRLDPLAIHLHSSVGETKCGAYSRSLSLRFSKL